MDRGAWWAAVHGVTGVRPDWATDTSYNFSKVRLLWCGSNFLSCFWSNNISLWAYSGLPRWHSVKEPACQCRRHGVRSLDWEEPLKETATHSSTLAGKMPWTEEPGSLQSMGLQRVGHDWLSTHAQGHMTHLKKSISIYLYARGLSRPLGRCTYAAMNIRSYVQVLHPSAFKSSGFSPRREAVRFHAILCLTFRWTTELSSGAAAQFYDPTSNVGSLQFVHILTNSCYFLVFCFFNNNHPNANEAAPHCDFDLYFSRE